VKRLLPLLFLTACSVEAVDFSDKTCPCDQGFICDETRNRCVEIVGDGSLLEGLVAYYPLDDVPATTGADPYGGGPTLECGVMDVCPRSTEGQVGGAFAFGGNEQHMRGTDDGRLVTATALTATVFVRPASLTRSAAFAKLRDSTEPGAITWALGVDGAGRAGFGVGNDTDGESWIWSEPFALFVDEWSHLAGTWDGVAMRLYVDGAEVASGAGTADTSRGDLLIGGNGESSSVLPWNGDVDEARLYDRELDAESIATLASP
jgi:hypothetical protein